MILTIVAGAEEVGRVAASRLVEAIDPSIDLVLGLPTGRTPIPFYDDLARRHRKGEIDASRVRTFNVDELVLPAAHPASFTAYMRRHVWGRTGLSEMRAQLPRASAPNLAAEAARYEKAVVDAGGLDFLFLGVGEDGHVAYNLPDSRDPRAHWLELPEGLADSLRVPHHHRPLKAITLGLASLLAARRCVLMAFGDSKASAIRALVEGPESAAWPCSRLRDHRDFEVIVDRAAASRLSSPPDRTAS